ncbi:GntR family transcriptional regulator [Novosphingobium sp. PP1Y]|uniref:GntR family transcriptional regulator n=1 Tax=Novosphingobium sp. PP1Y TaxID=702113 RepID=UPI00020EE5DA|nr:GntR family transcriptional regulator [Novosphingobium sp. PP1Y]CCA89838.1 GntR family transcriptional regulator [Novosphingobium sp. PP1Y]
MSPANVLEPTYQAIRQRLLAGIWPMGLRLETAKLAEDLGVSVTPVRDSLNRLAGECLVDLVPGMGFLVPQMTEAKLCDLLDLNLLALEKSVELCAPGNPELPVELPNGDHAARTQFVFVQIAALSGNTEMERLVVAIAARLHGTQLHEAAVLGESADEITRIWNEVSAARRSARLLDMLRRYHRRRKDAARELVAQLLS